MPVLGFALFYLLCLILVGVSICWLLDRLDEWRTNSPKQQAAWEREQREYLERLANPRYDEIEARVGFPVPRSLRELYAEPDFLTADAFQVPIENPAEGEEAWEVSEFIPIDTEALMKVANDHATTWLRFALDPEGDYYYALPLELCSEEDGPLYVICDGEEPEEIDTSLRNFLTRREPISQEE